jgi:hypothetical protein
MALAQLRVDPNIVEVVARADSAALTHGFVDACRDAQVRFSIGHDLTEPIRTACLAIPARRWRPAVTADGTDERDGAQVAEITDLVDLSRWPSGARAIARREEPHPGAQLTCSDLDGHRFQVFITDQTDPDIAYLEALQRGRGRYCLLHTAGQIARTGRRTRLRLAAHWPWATDLVTAFNRVQRLGLRA